MTKKYQGIIIPAVTPLTADHKLDHGAVERMFASFSQNNVYPFILGTTGESASLPYKLKAEFIELSAQLKQPGEMLYAGIASNCFEENDARLQARLNPYGGEQDGNQYLQHNKKVQVNANNY